MPGKERKEQKKISETMMTENFVKCKTPNQKFRNLRNSKQDKNQKSTPKPITFKLQETKNKEKILKETKGKKTLYL